MHTLVASDAVDADPGVSQGLLSPIRPGMRVWVSTMSTQSQLLRDELVEAPSRAAGVTFMGVQFPGIDSLDYLGVHPEARQIGFFMTPGLRSGMVQGRADLMPMDYLALSRHLQDMEPVDAAIAQVTTPDADGWCSPGLSADFLPLVWPRARLRLAHINPLMPRTRGSFRMHISEFDAAVEAAHPLLEFREHAVGATETTIAHHLAALVHDGDTLQFGIGGVPMAIAGSLANHRKLRIHSGMLGSAVRTLWESGALDRDARIVGGVLLGDASFHRFAAALQSLWLTDVRHTHDPEAIGRIPRFMAINGAVEVDLWGQVNAERTNGLVHAGAGGLPAFAQGAQRSAGGRLIICLPSTARKGTVSRIVPTLDAHSLCSVPRHAIDTVITEHGVAELRSLSVHARALALIRIAAPEHRELLEKAWREMSRRL